MECQSNSSDVKKRYYSCRISEFYFQHCVEWLKLPSMHTYTPSSGYLILSSVRCEVYHALNVYWHTACTNTQKHTHTHKFINTLQNYTKIQTYTHIKRNLNLATLKFYNTPMKQHMLASQKPQYQEQEFVFQLLDSRVPQDPNICKKMPLFLVSLQNLIVRPYCQKHKIID